MDTPKTIDERLLEAWRLRDQWRERATILERQLHAIKSILEKDQSEMSRAVAEHVDIDYTKVVGKEEQRS